MDTTNNPPTLRGIYPEWGLLSDKLNALCRRQDEIAAERRSIESEQARRNAAHFQAPSVDIVAPAPKRKPISAAARALLGSVAPAPEPEQPAAGPVFIHNGWGNEDLARLNKEYGSIDEAVAILRPRLTKAHAEGSKLLCAARLSDYRTVAARLSAALVELGESMLAHDALTRDMVSQGASWHDWRPIDLPTLKAAIGEPANRYSKLRFLLASAAEGGHMDATAIPPHWNDWATDPGVATADTPVVAKATKAKAPRDWKAGMRDALASANRSLSRIEQPD